MLFGVNLIFLHHGNQVVELVRVSFAGKQSSSVIARERLFNHCGLICEVQNESIVLRRMATVQSGKGLNCFYVIEHLVDIHRMKQRLIKTSLEHICNNKQSIRVCLQR